MSEKRLNDLFDDNKDISFGCVCFDLVEDDNGKKTAQPGAGWASIDGANAVRIKSMQELSNNVRWWSNLDRNLVWKAGGSILKYVKSSSYLKTELGDVMKELHMVPQNLTIATVCEYLSSIFNRVMRFAIEFYHIQDFQKDSLIEELHYQLIGSDANIENHIDQALMRAYQDFVFCETNPLNLEGQKKVYLKRPRVSHAQMILETRIPKKNSKWQVMFNEELPENREEKIQFLLQQDRPFICKVKILSFNEMDNGFIHLPKLLNLGESLHPKSVKKKRDWMCQTEFMYYTKFANLDVEAVIMAEQYDVDSYESVLPNLGPLGNMSYSYGLLAECVWHAFGDRSADQSNHNSKTLVSPRACWLKSTDRFLTLTSAMMLSSQGHQILSYGSGTVVVSVAEENIAKLIEQAPIAGLTVPRWLVEKYQLSKQLLS